ncbi:hypothetical protein MMC29_007640 [Sticta canariensis]|nr:hypothetical protein [Sticta canariensis]
MSLNGLEATVINEAYQSALGEGGGWFLLNYTTRDEVNLLGRGSGGLVEVKEAVDQYGEPSPLYGFINYRRRKVILKYLPEGTSRLLQARVAVHFQSIVEKLTPNDTTFTFVASSQLKDSALSSACSLHTASASIKSSSDSLRQKGLAEITEDAQEHQLGIGDDQNVNGGSVHSIGSEDTRARTLTPQEFTDEQKHHRARSTGHSLSPSRSTRTIRNTDKALPPTPRGVGRERKDYKISVDEKFDSGHTRSSFQSSRPSTRDIRSTYDYKSKVKLGPRPSLDSVNRPLTLDSFRNSGPRPVSTLPSSVRLPARKTGPGRKRSQLSQQPSHEKVSPNVSLSPLLPVLPIQTVETTSQTKLNGLFTPVRPSETKPPGMTPEKRKLMKALQLRQKQMAARVSPKPPETVQHYVALEQHQNYQTATSEPSKPKKDTQGVSGLKKVESEDFETVQTVFKDVEDSNQVIVESSPISIQEPSDGTSTLASSITDEEEVHIIKASDSGLVLELVSVKIPDQPPGMKQPHEVPLPPIDEVEAISLSHRNSSSEEENASPETLKPIKEYSAPVSIDFNHAQSHDEDLDATRPSTEDALEEERVDSFNEQHDIARSIRRASSADNSDDHFLSDDSFMEELGSATMQEAKPISVSKSPITPLFPRYPAEQQWIESTRKARSISGPVDKNRDGLHQLSPEMRPVLASRSVSASQPVTDQSQHASAISLKKVGVSTGISQRIKALEKLSSRPTSPSSLGHSPVVSPGTPPASVSLRKAFLPIPEVSSDMARNNGKSYRQHMSSLSPSSSPEADSLGPNHKSVNEGVTSRSKKPRPESISVTATIIRDPRNLMPALLVDPSEPSTADLYKSPLTVEHQPAEMGTSPLKPPTSKYSSARSASSCSTERKSDSPQPTRRDSFASRRSTPSLRGSEVDLPRSVSDTSSSGLVGPDGIKEDKKESRTSRLFRRMSNMSSASRRSIGYAFNPPVKDQPIVEHHETTYQAPPAMADFGDVNIQFPDTLLWKRRDMKIDDQGNLVLSSSKAVNNSRVVTKRYPLFEFHTPYIPDQDRQELPHSVILDFKDGATLQAGCENPSAQAELLKGMDFLRLTAIVRWAECLRSHH